MVNVFHGSITVLKDIWFDYKKIKLTLKSPPLLDL